MNKSNEDFASWHKTEMTIRFADLDKLSHVNNAKYLTYMETARIEYFLDAVGEEVNWSENGIILAKIVVDFIAPLNLDDRTVAVYTKCSRIGSKSFDLSYVIVKTKSRAIAAKGITTMVCYNYKEKATILIPGEWIEKLKEN